MIGVWCHENLGNNIREESWLSMKTLTKMPASHPSSFWLVKVHCGRVEQSLFYSLSHTLIEVVGFFIPWLLDHLKETHWTNQRGRRWQIQSSLQKVEKHGLVADISVYSFLRVCVDFWSLLVSAQRVFVSTRKSALFSLPNSVALKSEIWE